MLKLKPGMTIGDLGSGCGITSISFALYGATVIGFEYVKSSVDVANDMAKQILGNTGNPTFIQGAVNRNIGNRQFDRLHGGYMMSKENAAIYVKNNLKNGGIAVLNVGGQNYGEVYIYRKSDQGNITAENSGLGVIFQEDASPSWS